MVSMCMCLCFIGRVHHWHKIINEWLENAHMLIGPCWIFLFIWNHLSFDYMFSFCLQAVFWLIVPKLIREERIKIIMTIMLLIFLFQFLPKVYHSICMMRRMQKVTGYIFGTIWWGFGLNLIAYFIASHVSKPHKLKFDPVNYQVINQ